MKTHHLFANSRSLLGTLFLLVVFALSGAASPVNEAQSRMKERLGAIDELKQEGLIGENANGFLSVRGELGPRQRSLISAENDDRRTIYAAVASKTGQSIEAIGAQRALRIAEIAEPGVWLQRSTGEWIQKAGR